MALNIRKRKGERGVWHLPNGIVFEGERPRGQCERFETMDEHDAQYPEFATARAKASAKTEYNTKWRGHNYNEIYRLKRIDAERILAAAESDRATLKLHILDQEAELEGKTLTEMAEAVMAHVSDPEQLVSAELERRRDKKAWRELPD